MRHHGPIKHSTWATMSTSHKGEIVAAGCEHFAETAEIVDGRSVSKRCATTATDLFHHYLYGVHAYCAEHAEAA